MKVRISDRLNIIFNNEKKSSFESLISEFSIDNFGNHLPIDKIIFTGDLGSQAMGDALPLDFVSLNYKHNKDLLLD